jgi:hypothetical protein
MVGKLVVVVVAAAHLSQRGPSRLSRWLVMISAHRLPLGMPAYRLRSEEVFPIQHPVTATAAATATTITIIITTAATATTSAAAATTTDTTTDRHHCYHCRLHHCNHRPSMRG